MDLQQTLARAAQGDRSALQSLLAELYPRVRELVHRELAQDFRRRHRWMLPLFSTGDVVQDVFVGVIQSLDGFVAADADALIRYTATLVQHRLLDSVRYHEAQRRDQRRRQDEPEEGLGAAPIPARDPTPSLTAALREQVGIYRAVLEDLPEKQRLLLELRLSDELPFATIATRLAIASADAARKAFHEAQARLLVKLRARGLKPPGDPA